MWVGFFLFRVCLLHNFYLTSYYKREYRKLTLTVCGGVFFFFFFYPLIIMLSICDRVVTVSVSKWYNVSI